MTRLFPGYHSTAFDTPEARKEVASLQRAVRQTMIRTLLHPYPRFLETWDGVRRLHMPVDGGLPDRGKIHLLLGEFRAGKSCVLQSYENSHPPLVGEGGVKRAVVRVEASANWDKAGLARNICAAMGPTPGRLNTDTAEALAVRRLIAAAVELLIVDDAHFLFDGRRDRAAAAKSVIQKVADGKFCNIVLAGPHFIERVVDADDQIGGRTHARIRLDGFRNRDRENVRQYREFLAGVDARLPFLNPSNLNAAEVAAELYRYSGGSVGWTWKLLEAAAYLALNDDAAAISDVHLRMAAANMPNAQGYIAFGKAG